VNGEIRGDDGEIRGDRGDKLKCQSLLLVDNF